MVQNYCLLTLFLLVATARAAEVGFSIGTLSTIEAIDVGPDAPALESGDCNVFLAQLVSSDLDSSNGVSESEYHSFLLGIEDPTYVAEYFEGYQSFGELPWVFRVVHKSLACYCQQLGLGDNCCKGTDAEISLLGLVDDVMGDAEQISELEEYRVLVCQQIAYVLAKSVSNPIIAAEGLTAQVPNPTPSDVASTNATTNTASTIPVPTTADGSTVQMPNPTPSATTTSNIDPSAIAPSTATSNTEPSATVPSDSAPSTMATSDGGAETNATMVGEQAGDTGQVGGIGKWGIVGIILAVMICCVVCVLLEVSRDLERFLVKSPTSDVEAPPLSVEERDLKPQPTAKDDDGSSVSSGFSEEEVDDELLFVEDEEGKRATAGSALAAMGAASTVAATLIAPHAKGVQV